MNLRTGWRFIWDSVEASKRKSAHESINRFYLIEHHAHKNARLQNHTIKINSLQKIRTYTHPCTFNAQLQATGHKLQPTSNPSFIIFLSKNLRSQIRPNEYSLLSFLFELLYWWWALCASAFFRFSALP